MIQKMATSVAFFTLIITTLSHTGSGLASDSVYKCGDTFTNDAVRAKREKCPLLERDAMVTIPSQSQQKAVAVTQTRSPNLSHASKLKPKPATSALSAEQQARDQDAKAIIQSELKKTEAQLLDLHQQYNALSSPQDLERKQAVKQKIARAEADVLSLKRELQR